MTDAWATSWTPIVADTKKPLKLKSKKLNVGAIGGVSIVVGQKKVQVPLASNKSLKQLDITLLEKHLEILDPPTIWRESGNEALMILTFQNLDPQLAVEETKNIIRYNLGQFGFCPINQEATKRLLNSTKLKHNWDLIEYEKTWTALVGEDFIPKSKQVFCSILQVVSPQILLDTTKLSAIVKVSRTGVRIQDSKIQGLLFIEGDDEDDLEKKVLKLRSDAFKDRIELESLTKDGLLEAWSVFEGLPIGVNK